MNQFNKTLKSSEIGMNQNVFLEGGKVNKYHKIKFCSSSGKPAIKSRAGCPNVKGE
jgi:hypothetical protein